MALLDWIDSEIEIIWLDDCYYSIGLVLFQRHQQMFVFLIEYNGDKQDKTRFPINRRDNEPLQGEKGHQGRQMGEGYMRERQY